MKIYLIAAVAIMIGGAYFCGVRIARSECAARISELQSATAYQNNEIQRIANEETVHTAVHDIRNILRDKYTIAE